MLNVGGGGPRHEPLVRGLTIAFNKFSPLLGRNQWLPILSTGTNQKWPTCGHSRYLTPAPGLTPRNITHPFSRSPW